jgi:Zn-dependent protease
MGIPISVELNWLIILAILTLSIASRLPSLLHEYSPSARPERTSAAYWVMGLVTAVALFACLLLHELGHWLVARARGISIHGITLFLFGGVADIEGEPPSAATEFVMAVAGPAVSLVHAAVFWVLVVMGYHSCWPHAVVVVLGYLGAINGLVLAFNWIPAFPLDGGRVLRSILWAVTGNLRRATYLASFAGQAFAWLLIAWGIVHLFAGDWLGGVWMGLIGFFPNRAAQGSYQQVLINQTLRSEPVARLMNPSPVPVPPALNLHHCVEDFVYRYHHRAFPVVSEDGRLKGLINTEVLKDLPREDRSQTTVGEAMQSNLPAFTLLPHGRRDPRAGEDAAQRHQPAARD